MNKIINAELSLTIENIHLDLLKSDYMYSAQELMWKIFDAENDMSPESQKEIDDAIEYLIESKKDLIDAINYHIRLVDGINRDVEDYLMGMIE